jgi:hypothetical protein
MVKHRLPSILLTVAQKHRRAQLARDAAEALKDAGHHDRDERRGGDALAAIGR